MTTDGAVLGDLLFAYETEGWRAQLNIRNVTDGEYFSTCVARGDCFPGEARTVVARFVKRF